MNPKRHHTESAPNPSVEQHRTTLRRLGRLALVALALLLVVSAAAGAQQMPPSSQLVLDLHADGSAELRLTEVYALDSAADRAAFERLQSDPSVRTALQETFSDRMGRVAATAAAETDRDMRVSESNLTLTTAREDALGVVTVTVSWERVAEVGTDGRLILEEPLASGFTPDRTFVLELPAGYAAESIAPEPTRRDDQRLVWSADTELTGFRLVATPTSSSSGDPAAATGSPGQPGFGPLAALGAVLALVLVAKTRRR